MGDGATRWVCEATLPLELGVGEEGFEPLPADGTLLLWRGTQGLQHVFVGARLAARPQDVVVERALFEMRLWEPGAAEPLEPAQPFGAALIVGDDAVTVVGARYVVQEPTRVLGRSLLLTVAMRPVGWSEEGRGVAAVRLAWGPGQEAAETDSDVADSDGAP